MEWHDRLNLKIKEKGWTTAEFARRSGLPYERAIKYVNGAVRQPRGGGLDDIAGALGVTPQWLMFGPSPLDSEKVSTEDLHAIGLGKIMLMKIDDFSNFDAVEPVSTVWDKVSKTQVSEDISAGCFALRCHDESLSPDITQGDLLVFDPDAENVPGMLALVQVDKHPRPIIRKYNQTRLEADGSVLEISLTPINPAFGTMHLSGADSYHIIGRAIQHIRNL